MTTEFPRNMSLFNSNTLIEEGTLVHAVMGEGTAVTGTVSKIVLLSREDDDNRLHTLVFITQQRRYVKQEGKLGLVSEWFDQMQSLEMLEDQPKDTTKLEHLIDEFDHTISAFGMKHRYSLFPPLEPEKSIIISNLYINRNTDHCWCGYCCYNGVPTDEFEGYNFPRMIVSLSCWDESFIFTIPEFLYRMDHLRTLGIRVIVDTEWSDRRHESSKRNRADYIPKKTPTSDFFEEVLNDMDYPPEQKVLVISKFDQEGNWAAFHCARENGSDTFACGGHIGLCSKDGDSYLTGYDLLYWFDRFRKRGIEVVVNEKWFLTNGAK